MVIISMSVKTTCGRVFAVVSISDKHPFQVTSYTLGLECALEERVCSYLTLQYSSSTRDRLQWAAKSQEGEKQREEGETSKSWVLAKGVCMGHPSESRRNSQAWVDRCSDLESPLWAHGLSSGRSTHSSFCLHPQLPIFLLEFSGIAREGHLTERPNANFPDTDQMFN